MPRDQWSTSAGGVCNNCGEPRLAHTAKGECPDDEKVAKLTEAIDLWHQQVDPAKRLKEHARRHAKSMRNWYGKGWCEQSHLDRAEQILKLATAQYEAMIRLADAQAERG